MTSNFVVKKFNGDDSYSFAVFKKEDIKGLKGIIMYGQAKPVVAGCSKQEALSYKKSLELKSHE